MSIVVEATIPANEFALPETLTGPLDEAFRAVRLVAHESGRAMPYLWVDATNAKRLRRSMDDDPTVREVTVVTAFGGQCLLRVEWTPRVQVFLSVLRAEGAFVLAASGYDGAWHLRIYFSAHDCVSAARECCEARGINISFKTESGRSGACEFGSFGLTDCQYETLITAYELGYYNVPREITQAELADRLGITHQALSERIRRAHETLVENGLPKAAHQHGLAVPSRLSAGVDI